MKKTIDNAVIENISKILGELTTGSKISNMFSILGYYDADTQNHGRPFSTKWRRINETVIHECNREKSGKPFFKIIEHIMKPQEFIDSPEGWTEHRREINAQLMFYGYELNDSGKIENVEPVQSFTDAQKRLQSFEDKLSQHDIHPIILKFCNEELFHQNYFHAILEASKSVLQRVRDISELSDDGTKLIHSAFSTKNPIILIKNNMLETQTDKSLYNGLKNLLETIVSLYRNPNAHLPKLYDITSETDAITAFTLMSLAHRILDDCFNVRDFDKG